MTTVPAAGFLGAFGEDDPHGLDGPHRYTGLGFVPVPGDPRAMADLGDAADTIAGAVVRAAGTVDTVRAARWEGADADAFRARLGTLPPMLRRYAGLLRRFAELLTEGCGILRAAKGQAESLDREAAVVREQIGRTHSGLVPVLSPETQALYRRLETIVAEATDLCGRTQARLRAIGDEIEGLSRCAPHLPAGGADRIIDTIVDNIRLDDVLLPGPVRRIVDSHPAEAHALAQWAGDALDALPVTPNPYTVAVDVALHSVPLAVESRLYRTGATNARGEALVTRTDVVMDAVSALPAPRVGRAVPVVGTAAAVPVRTDQRGQPGPDVRTRPLGWLAQEVDALPVSGAVPVGPVLTYLDGRGIGPAPSPPDVRLVTERATPPAGAGPRSGTGRTR